MRSTSAEARGKFDRARQHLSELQTGIAAYMARNPVRVSKEDEPESGDLVWRLVIGEAPPTQLSMLLGDAIHNARAGLDHIAWQLVLAGGGTPRRDTEFPISETRDKFNGNYRKKLRGASAAAVAAVQRLQPFMGGNDAFWRLHALDVEDKHHLPIAVGATYEGLGIRPPIPEGFDIDPFPVLELKPAESGYILTHGVVLYRVPRDAREDARSASDPVHFRFVLAFGSGSAAQGESIIPTVPDLINGVESAVAPLFDFLS